MSLRVIGGEAKGRLLLMPRGIRPSAGITREAMFNLLAPHLTGASVIDLYAGSGAIGIEALSRGAGAALFVERDQRCLGVLQRNLVDLGYVERSRVVATEVERWMRRQPQELAAADIILADPPYGPDQLLSLVQLLERHAPTGALVVVEHSSRDQLPLLGRLGLRQQKRYGDSALAVMRVE